MAGARRRANGHGPMGIQRTGQEPLCLVLKTGSPYILAVGIPR